MNFEDFGEKMGIHKIDHEIIEKVFCSLSIDYFCLDFGNKMQQMYLSCKNLWGFVQIKMKACNFKNVLILLPLLLSWVSLVCIVSIICHPCSILWSQVLHHAARLAALEMLHPLLSTCLLDDTWHCRFCVVLGVKGRVGHWAGPWEKMLN